MATPSADRISRMLALHAVIMTEHLLAIAMREAERGPTLVFAHNWHFWRRASQIWMDTMNADWWPAGAQLLGRATPDAVAAMSSGKDAALRLSDAGEGQNRHAAHLYATPGRL